MLFLLTPPDTIQWNDVPTSMLAVATEHGADLARLDWQPSERRGIADVLPLALRYGVKCSTGLVLAGHYVADADHSRQIAETHRAANESHEKVEATHGALMERLLPGWTDSGRELTARVDAESAAAVQRAQQKADQALALPEDDDLAAHWTALGGHLPAA